ncbi:Ion channel regulatory protein UNC-93 [Mactra antiquata]
MDKHDDKLDVTKGLLKKVEYNKITQNVEINTVPVETTTRIARIPKVGVIRNLLVISISFMFEFSAFDSFASLQSSLNKEEGLGTTGQAIIYSAMVLSSLLLTPLTMSRVTEKWVMVISMFTYLIYVATGFYPSWYTIIPASVIIGTGAAHLWLALQSYITELAKQYAVLTDTEQQDRLSLFLGIFYGFMFATLYNLYCPTNKVAAISSFRVINAAGSDTKTMDEHDDKLDTTKGLLKKVEYNKITRNVEINTVPVERTTKIVSISKVGIIRNLLVISISFMFEFSAFNSFSSLQSSLNKEEGLGTTGQAVIYAAMVLSSLLLTPVTMSRVTEKWVIVVSMFTYLTYVATGFYPSWYTVIPASVIIGTGAAHLWLALQSYITELAKHYSLLTNTEHQDRLNLFLGIFYGFTYTNNIWGNLISSFVFQNNDSNTTIVIEEVICGPKFCPHLGFNSTNIIEPSKQQIYIYTSACCGFISLALMLMVFLVSDIPGEKTSEGMCKLVQQVSRLILTSRTQHLLLCPSLLGGLTAGFIASDFTQAYISCSYGVQHVGFTMIVFGIFQSMGSIVFGKLNQHTGHLAIYLFGCMVQIGTSMTLLHWTPVSSERYVIYILAAMFGIAGSINIPMVSAGLRETFQRPDDSEIHVFMLELMHYSTAVLTNSKSAFNSFTSLQSSLNKEDGLGTTGLAVLYTMMLLSSLIMTPVSMSKLSSKWVMVISMFTYLIYVCTGFYSSWYTIIPASVIIGTGGSHLWLASQNYITDLARYYVSITGDKLQDTLTLFLGVFYAFLYTCNIWGNLISSFVFHRDEVNTTLIVNEQLCGPNFCPYVESNSTNIIKPPEKQIYIYTGACCGFIIVAMFLMIVLVTDISIESTSSNVCTLIQQVSRQMCTSKTQHLLFFPSLLGGLTFAFISGDFTQAYVSCSYGVKNVGLAMIVYGIFQSAGSIIFGKLNQYTGHLAIYIFGCLVQATLHIILLHWTPVSSQQYVIYILAAMCGIAGAVNIPMISALYNLYFTKNKVAAISSYRVLYAAGNAINMSYSNWLCSRYKLYILVTIVGLSCISLIVQHIRYNRKQSNKSKESTTPDGQSTKLM